MRPVCLSLVARSFASITALGIGISGCGASQSTIHLTDAQLVARGEAICKHLNDQLFANGLRNKQELVSFTKRTALFKWTAANELAKLNPPPRLTADWRLIVAGARASAEDTAKYGELIATHHTTAASRLFTSASRTQQRAFAVAKRDGFVECAQSR